MHITRLFLPLAYLIGLIVLPLGGRSASYYVATNGVTANPGTLVLPFQTIQKAASLMVAGDTCYVRGGTYRGNVTPVHSGTPGSSIIYQNYSNEVAIINGTEAVTGWTLDSGSVYKAAMAERR